MESGLDDASAEEHIGSRDALKKWALILIGTLGLCIAVSSELGHPSILEGVFIIIGWESTTR
jgi:hypothetical protein